MQVPVTLSALWAQRKRWARGQGEVLNVHLGQVMHWRNRRMWLISIESLASLIWIVVLALSFVLTVLVSIFGGFGHHVFGYGLAWGIAIAVVAMVQLSVALALEHTYDPTTLRAVLVAVLYPVGYWLVGGCAALRSQTVALLRGPRDERVVWDIPRESPVRRQLTPTTTVPNAVPDGPVTSCHEDHNPGQWDRRRRTGRALAKRRA